MEPRQLVSRLLTNLNPAAFSRKNLHVLAGFKSVANVSKDRSWGFSLASAGTA
jgi:hypothetical protein